MYTVLIVDDELHGRENLSIIINENFTSLKVIDTASGAFDARNKILTHKPDIVFLDINMDTVNGLELLETFTDKTFEAIFVTAYKNYAIDALKLGAVGYVLKPIILSELSDVVTNACLKIDIKKNEILISQPIETQGETTEYLDKIMINHTEGYTFVNTVDIIKIEALNNYCKLYLSNGQNMTTSKTLKSVQEQLNPQYFSRVHKTFLVNLIHVKGFKSKGIGVLVLSDDSEVKVAVLKHSAIRKQLTKFINV